MPEEKIVAFCGIICSGCPAFIAKQTNDNELRKKTAEEWSTEEWPLKASDINCDGCTSGGEVVSFCVACDVWKCGTEKGLKNCAFCAVYPCEKLEMPWSQVPQAKEILDKIREALNQQ